jgi:hypothetical protein
MIDGPQSNTRNTDSRDKPDWETKPVQVENISLKLISSCSSNFAILNVLRDGTNSICFEPVANELYLQFGT